MTAPAQLLWKVDEGYIHYCPGCAAMPGRGSVHVIYTENKRSANWAFNDNMEAPTFSPSVRVSGNSGTECHYFIKDGKIEYCGDSVHALAGQTIPMVPMTEDWDPA